MKQYVLALLLAIPVTAHSTMISCTAGNSTFSMSNVSGVAFCNTGNVNGNIKHDRILQEGFVLLDKTDSNSGIAPGSLVLDNNRWQINTQAVTGYSNFIIALKAGPGYGSFFTNNTEGKWLINRDLSHANLYGSPVTPVPVPAAIWLFGSVLGLLGMLVARAKYTKEN